MGLGPRREESGPPHASPGETDPFHRPGHNSQQDCATESKDLLESIFQLFE